MILSGILKLLGVLAEFFLGIPAIGGTFILSLLWTPLLFMLVYYIITLVVSRVSGAPIWGPVVGIITSVVGFIPFVGMTLHWIAFFCLLADGILTLRSKDRSQTGKL
ncbi:hypothetical protein F9U64_21740 [Gracilibacillus oryzae]|uniref:Uncharacterized protein n=1 Tax=Gracilibacillus oryzae TaxID=1672701 RepID=A0A7C8KRU7_9BACI|nr:hypothetical protein [Gracilibacillus oryzae]KAB8125767.1 hypothetical protein F9U64_21740 [Gracilibacillus oryzae]